MADAKRYYHTYEDRYASVYSHGAEYWTADPEEIRDTAAKLQDFLDRWALLPGQVRVVEFGCGEGHLAQYLIERSYDYRGVDLSPSALAKARQRVADLEVKGDTFILGDITGLPVADDGAFDVVVDNFCLHMLVTDDDRRRYLATVRRVLRADGMAFFHENHTARPMCGPVATFEDFVSRGGFTPGLSDERTVYVDGAQRAIRLVRVPFRGQDEVGYRQELEEAGLAVQHVALDGAGHCVIHAKRSG